MKKRNLFKLLALALCMAFTLTACSLPFDFDFFGNGGGKAKDAGPSRERRTIPYSDMAYERPDLEALTASFEDLTEQLRAAEDFNTLMELDEQAGELYEQFDSMNALAMLNKYHDATDSHWEEEYRILEEAKVDMQLLLTDFNRVIVEGPYADDYRAEVGDYVYKSIENDLLLNLPSVEKYKKERNDLAVTYNQLLANLTYTFEGTEYTPADLYSADSEVMLRQLYDGLFVQNADEFTEIYARMVELDKLTAYELGFDSPADMYYLSYSRDFTPDDAQKLCDTVKETLVPLTLGITLRSIDLGDIGAVDQAATFGKMPEMLGKVDAELVEAFEFMQEYGLYDSDSLPGKQSGVAFTTTISQYDAPFLFMNWDSADFRSASTLTHEFGHFYDFWLHYDDSVVFNLDIAEVYSQALELLMHEQYPTLTDNAESARLDNLSDIATGALVYQSLLEEFQLRVCELDSFDATILGRLYDELLAEYGMSWNSITDENGANHTWFQVTHLFDAPFYTISYVTSAAAAMQIWAKSQDNWDAAAQTYLDLIHEDQNQPFADLLKGAGLRSVHDRSVMSKIAAQLDESFGVTELYREYGYAA